MEYTIDGYNWNHISTDFNTLAEVKDFIKKKGIADFAKKIKLLTVLKEEIMEMKNESD